MTNTKPHSELLPPFGRETALLAGGLTKSEEEDTIVLTAQADPLISKRNLS